MLNMFAYTQKAMFVYIQQRWLFAIPMRVWHLPIRHRPRMQLSLQHQCMLACKQTSLLSTQLLRPKSPLFLVTSIMFGLSALQGGWISVWMIISGFVLFTCGSMSQQNAGEGAESSWTLTVLPAIASAAMARNFYLKAIAGVTGESCCWCFVCGNCQSKCCVLHVWPETDSF